MADIFIGKLMPFLLLEGCQKCVKSRPSILPSTRRPKRPEIFPTTQGPGDINIYLPMELLREIFLYCIEVNQMKSGKIASVCRHWRSVITSIASLWSTLRVGAWTETERVATWLQRAYPKKVVIGTQRDRKTPTGAPAFSALQDALKTTGQWHELTISSFPPEEVASQLGIQVSSSMDMLKVLHIAAECVHSPSSAHLLNLVPIEAPLCELRLHPAFASTHFLQPHWSPVLQNLTVFIVNGRGMDEPFELLPTFTQLQIFKADRLRLPFYEPNTNLPLLYTLRELQIKACSVQWMAGRQFPRLEECSILLPRHWELLQQHEVQLPSCKKLTYHGHPMTTARYFHVLKMREMELKSHDCNEQRAYRHLRHLCRVDGRISKLTTLRLTFQCSERVLIKVLKYLDSLQELVLSIAHPSPSWQIFLESLAAKPSTNEWPTCGSWRTNYRQWEKWCSSQTWHVNVLPRLKCLGIQCPKGFTRSECLDNLPFLRLVGWTRAHLIPPLEHLEVWEGKGITGDLVVDYISTGYLWKHLRASAQEYDSMIVMGMVTQCLIIHYNAAPLFRLHSTVFFRQLQYLELTEYDIGKIPIFPCLEQIKWLDIKGGFIPVYSLNLDLPLTRTVHWIRLRSSTSSWMLGRTFKALRELQIDGSSFALKNMSKHEGLQVDLPACTILHLEDFPMDHLCFLSCSNVQILCWSQFPKGTTIDSAVLNSLQNFLFTLLCLQQLDISIYQHPGLDSFIQFVFCGAWEEGVWRDIRSVEVNVVITGSSRNDFFSQMIGHQQHYEKWWKEFTVTENALLNQVRVRAST